MEKIKRFWSRLPHRMRVILLFSLISLLLLLPEILFGGGTGLAGGDAAFHMNRYLNAAMQIYTGHFQPYQQFFAQNYSGQLTNNFYGALPTYLIGLILVLVNFHGLIFGIIYSWLLLIAAMASMYYMLRKQGIEDKHSILVSVLYSLSFNVISAFYYAGVNTIAYAFFPLIISVSLRLFKENDKPVSISELTVTLILLLQVHSGTAMFAIGTYGLSLVVYAGAHFKSRQVLKIFKPLLLSFILVLIFTFNVWGWSLEIFRSNSNLSAASVQSGQLYLPLSLTLTPGASIPDYTQFFVLILLFLIALIGIKDWKNLKLRERFALFMLISFGLLSFGIFNVGIFTVFNSIQFYCRFAVIFYCFGFYLISYFLQNKSFKLLNLGSQFAFWGTVLLFLSMTTTGSQTFYNLSTSDDPGQQLRFEAQTNPKLWLDQTYLKEATKYRFGTHLGDQLPNFLAALIPNNTGLKQANISSDKEISLVDLASRFFNDVYDEAGFKGKNLTRAVTNQGLQLTWTSAKNEETVLPVLKYGHTHVVLNGKELSDDEITLSSIGAVGVQAQKGKNTMLVYYQPARWFSWGLIVQGVAVLVMLFYGIVRLVKKTKSGFTR